MYTGVMQKIVLMSGFLVALICFAWNMYSSGDILYSAFVALCVLFAASTVFLIAVKSIAQVLFRHLNEKKMEQMKMMAEKKRQEQHKGR